MKSNEKTILTSHVDSLPHHSSPSRKKRKTHSIMNPITCGGRALSSAWTCCEIAAGRRGHRHRRRRPGLP
eukprot:scaffold22093_cov145-Isochrysis_galbana.AAC.7